MLKVKIKKEFFLWTAASLICMLVIFMFSAQNSEKSTDLSNPLANKVFEVINDLFKIDKTEKFMDFLGMLVRKAAHIFIFFVLGFCVTNSVRQLIGNPRYIFLISMCIGSLYAATDEIHQYFVPGRACMFRDWVIDTVGVLIGCCVFFLIKGISRRKTQSV